MFVIGETPRGSPRTKAACPCLIITNLIIFVKIGSVAYTHTLTDAGRSHRSEDVPASGRHTERKVIPMAVETPPTPPPAPQIPQWIVTLMTFLAGSIKNPFLHSILTAALAAFGTLYLAKQSLPNFIPNGPHGLIPRILPKPKKAEDAIGRIQFGNAGCTATIIGPVSSDDLTLDILTAAHCVKVGAVGKMTLKDGRDLRVKCVARDATSDAAWLVADNPGGNVPYLLLADGNPQNGEIVWHQGYGIDKPGNRESGLFKGSASNGQQCQFRLSVSPGDSGGGIILDSLSRVVSPVCCTTRLSATGDVFGAAPEYVAKLRPKKHTSDEEPSLFYPVLPMPDLVLESPPADLTPPGGWPIRKN